MKRNHFRAQFGRHFTDEECGFRLQQENSISTYVGPVLSKFNVLSLYSERFTFATVRLLLLYCILYYGKTLKRASERDPIPEQFC